MATIATLAINLIGNVSGLKSALGEAQQSIKATSESLKSVGTKMTAAVSLPILGVAGAALKGAAEMEQLEVAFTTMLRSGEKAKSLLADLTTFSADTPFELPEVVNAGKMLLAYGVEAENVQGVLRQLGDIAAGVGAPIGDIAYLFGTARVQGRLFAADINQFTNRGIPIISALAKTMGVAEGSVKKLVEEGKVGFPEMARALDYLTTNGGQFEGLMAAQSQTLAGLFSTLKDNIGITLATIGRSIVEAFDLRGKLGGVLEFLGQVKDFIVNLAQTNPELLKTAVIIAAVAAAIGPLMVGLGAVVGALGNLVPLVSALLGPMGLLAAVVVGLGIAWYTNFGGIRDITEEVWASVQPVLREWVTWLQARIPLALATMRNWASTAWASVSDASTQAGSTIQSALDGLRAGFVAVATLLTPSLARLQSSFTTMSSQFGEMGPLFADLQESIGNTISALMPLIQSFGLSIGAALGIAAVLAVNTLTAVFEALPGVVEAVVSQVTAILDLIATTVQSMAQIVNGVLSGDFASAWEGVKTLIGGVATYAQTTLGNLGATVLLAFTLVRNVLVTTFTDLASSLGLDGVVTAINNIDTAVRNVMTSIGNFPETIATNAPEWINTLIEWDWPEFGVEASEWVSALLEWDWPTFGIEAPGWVTTLTDWDWPEFGIEAPGWVTTLTDWDWPTFNIQPPGWVLWLMGWDDGGESPVKRAIGDGFFAGGWTWVGENGSEMIKRPGDQSWNWVGVNGQHLMNLPRGTEILSHTEAMKFVRQGTMSPIAQMASGTTTAPQPPVISTLERMARQYEATVGKLNNNLDEISTTMKTASEDLVDAAQDIRSALERVPGLFQSSGPTAQQMRLAELGLPQNFADDWLRRLTDEVVNGVDWADVDIKDAALRAGLDPSLPARAILELVTQQWNDQSFFANRANLDLINMDAVKEELTKQAAQKAGQENIFALFGVTPDVATTQAVALGGTIRTGLEDGLSRKNSAADGQLLTDLISFSPGQISAASTTLLDSLATEIGKTENAAKVGKPIVALFETFLSGEGALSEVSKSIVNGVASQLAILPDTNMVIKFVSSFVSQIRLPESMEALRDVGQRILKYVYEGYVEAAKAEDWANNTVNVPSTSGANAGTNALGTQYWRGGATWVGDGGKPELLVLPRGSQVIPERFAGAGAGGPAVVVDKIIVNNEADAYLWAYEVDDLRRRRRR